MNLEQLRKQAKELVRAARSGDAKALERLGGREPILASAQLVLAREHGYPSWPALVAALEASVEAFVRAATDRRCERAERLLAARPEIAQRSVGRARPRPGLGRRSERAGRPAELGADPVRLPFLLRLSALARELLERGADPNATFTNEYGEMSALYGAAGVVHDPELTRILLEAGANPDDGESLYHSVEHGSTECTRLLLEHGATVDDQQRARRTRSTTRSSSMSASARGRRRSEPTSPMPSGEAAGPRRFGCSPSTGPT